MLIELATRTRIKKAVVSGRTEAGCLFLKCLFIGLLPPEDLIFIEKK